MKLWRLFTDRRRTAETRAPEGDKVLGRESTGRGMKRIRSSSGWSPTKH